MTDIRNISRELGSLSKYPADYLEIHLEESSSNRISYRGREMDSVDIASSSGGNVRALVGGGWGFASFNSLDNLKQRIDQAIRQARFINYEKIKLAETQPYVDTVPARIIKDPSSIPLAKKKELLDRYNEIIWNTPGMKTSNIGYGDSRRRYILLNSPGCQIEQERSDVTLRLTTIAAKDGDVQQVGLSVGSLGDFDKISNLDKEVKEMSQRAVQMLSASHVKGGEYTVVLDPILAGVFVHEAFGHLSESDFVYEDDRMQEIMTLGKEFGSKDLNIIDSASDPGLRGSFKYDDEGVPSTKTYLIREGKLVGRLHSRETAAKMLEKVTGNARAINYRHPPIVRMTNTYIEPKSTSFNDMIADIKEGVYARNWHGGTTSMEMFTFSAGEAYMIHNGKIAEPLRPVVLTGNVFTTLQNIDAIGNDLDMNEGGGCGKSGQSPLPVSNGSPHIRIRHCLVGGR